MSELVAAVFADVRLMFVYVSIPIVTAHVRIMYASRSNLLRRACTFASSPHPLA